MNNKPTLYIIAGANGAGKTTSSFTIFPELLKCKEYINADLIAKAISPFNPDSVSIEAGKVLLRRIETLISEKTDFAFETTLASKSVVRIIQYAKSSGYKVIILFFFLKSYTIAFKRVKERVRQGGHNIPKEVIKRRFYRGISNLLNTFINICDYCIIVDNSGQVPRRIAEIKNNAKQSIVIFLNGIWDQLKNCEKEKN